MAPLPIVAAERRRLEASRQRGDLHARTSWRPGGIPSARSA